MELDAFSAHFSWPIFLDRAMVVLCQDEVRLVLLRVGYTPLRAVILDLIDAVGPVKGDLMDFDEFVEMQLDSRSCRRERTVELNCY